MSTSDLFRGDPSLLLLGDIDDDALSGGGLLGELSPSVGAARALATPAAPPPPAARVRPPRPLPHDAPTPRGGLVDRVRAGAEKGRRAARHLDDADVEIFDEGYDVRGLGAPSPAATPRLQAGGPTMRVSAAVTERIDPVEALAADGPEIIDRSPPARSAPPRGDRFERATGDVLPAVSTVYDFGYTDEVVPPPELRGRVAHRPSVSPDRSAGPLRIFVGRPGAGDGPGRRSLPDLRDGPVWDASALADGAEEWGDRSWGSDEAAPLAMDDELLGLGDERDHTPIDLGPGAVEDLSDVLPPPTAPSAGGLRVGFRPPDEDDVEEEEEEELLEALADDDPEQTDAAPLPAADPEAFGDFDSFDSFEPGDALAAEAFSDPSSADLAPLFPAAQADRGRPWWMPAEDEADDPEPPRHPTGDHSPALPDLTLGRPRLEDELARPMPEESPSAAIRRQAPWRDPDPWSTGSFRRVGGATGESVIGSTLDTLNTSRRDRVARPATSLPELEPLESERRASGVPTQLVLGALLVVGVVAILVQVARMRGGPLWASLSGEAVSGASAELVLPDRPVGSPAPAPATLPPSEAEAQPAPSDLSAAEAAPVAAAVEPPPAAAPAASSLPSRTAPSADSDMETGMVQIVAPARSRIWLDGTYVGRAPLGTRRLAIGRHEIKVSGRVLQVTVTPGRLATVDFTR